MRFNLSACALTMALLSGCGETPPPPSAAKEINAAQDAIDTAKVLQGKGKFKEALDQYTEAREQINKGKAIAEGTELKTLKNMDDDVREKLFSVETRVSAMKEPEKPKTVAAAKGVDVAEATRKAEDARKKKESDKARAASQDIAAKLEIKEDKAAQVAKQDDSDDAPDKKKPEGNAIVENIKAANTGPFPEVTEKSPPVEIVKLFSKGEYVFAYIQLYNNTEQGKRIMAGNIFFKNKDNQVMINPASTGVFLFQNFKADAKDPFEQPTAALTSGSMQVTGMEGLRLVAVGQHPKAAEVRKIGVKFVFDQGASVTATGPEGNVDTPVPPILKGLK